MKTTHEPGLFPATTYVQLLQHVDIADLMQKPVRVRVHLLTPTSTRQPPDHTLVDGISLGAWDQRYRQTCAFRSSCSQQPSRRVSGKTIRDIGLETLRSCEMRHHSSVQISLRGRPNFRCARFLRPLFQLFLEENSPWVRIKLVTSLIVACVGEMVIVLLNMCK